MRRTLPRMGQRCSTPTGEGKVVGLNVLRHLVTLDVGGQRIEVGERDLGLVVRWDPAARNAAPPPSITREEAIAQGLIEPEEEPEPEPELEPVAAMPEAAPIELGRESREAPARGRNRPSRRRGRGRQGGQGGDRPASPQPQKSQEAPTGRVFRRSSSNRPSGEPASGDPQSPSPQASSGDQPQAGGGRKRRRRRRRRGGGGGGGNA